MRRALRVAGEVAFTLVEPALIVPLVLAINYIGWFGGHPTWVLLAFILPALFIALPRVQNRLFGRDPGDRLWLRMGVHLVVCLTPAIYVTGWGPVLSVGYLLASLPYLRWVGSRAWRPAAVFTAAGMALGLTAVALGLADDNFGSPKSMVICLVLLLISVLLLRQFGETLAQREAAEQIIQISQAAARRSERWFRALVQNTSDVVTIVDAAGLITWVTPSVENQLGHSPADLLGGPAEAILDPADRDNFESFKASVLGSPGVDLRAELRLWHADGTPRWYEVTAHNLLADAEVAGIVINHRDVHERRAYHDLLAFDASHDALTGLANRAELHRVLDESLVVRSAAMAAAAGTRAQVPTVAVLLVDLDGFKPVNDKYGHETGDALLVAVARLLERNVLGVDTVARIGGDEFAVVLGGITQESDAIAVAQRMLRALQVPMTLPRAQVRVGASIGIALVSDDVSAVELLRQADHAMYRAKREGRNRWAAHWAGDEGIDVVVPDPKDLEAEAQAHVLERDLRQALATDTGLSLAYQPIVWLADRSLWGFEALVRWEHPTRGPISPADFIPVAERSGAIRELGRWVLEQSCMQLAAWQQQLPENRTLNLSVNLSPRELDQPGLARRILQTVNETGVIPETLVIEVTESALVDPDMAIATLTELSLAGLRIAIDDFGTGYSSLQYLNQMPVDVLKLDRSFVTRLDGSAHNAAIAEAVVRISETLQLGTVAEGVETEDQARELAELGYSRGQGYLFSRPIPADKVQGLLDAQPETVSATGGGAGPGAATVRA